MCIGFSLYLKEKNKQIVQKIKGTKITVTGVKKIKPPHKEVYCDESGSTLRFLIPIFSLSQKKVIFSGERSLIKRPQKIYEKIFNDDSNIFKVNKINLKGSKNIIQSNKIENME